jgi:hypothetical protein
MLGNPGGESDAQSETHFRCWKGAIYCNVFELMPSLHFITCRWKWMIRMTCAIRHRGNVLESMVRTRSRPFEFTSWSGVAILLTSARLLPWYTIIHGTVQEHTWIWLCPHLLVYPVGTCVWLYDVVVVCQNNSNCDVYRVLMSLRSLLAEQHGFSCGKRFFLRATPESIYRVWHRTDITLDITCIFYIDSSGVD